MPADRPLGKSPSRAELFPMPVAPAPESREPHSIRFTPTEWERIASAAKVRLLEPAVFVRALTMYALHLHSGPSLSEAALGVLPEPLAGAQRTRRI